MRKSYKPRLTWLDMDTAHAIVLSRISLRLDQGENAPSTCNFTLPSTCNFTFPKRNSRYVATLELRGFKRKTRVYILQYLISFLGGGEGRGLGVNWTSIIVLFSKNYFVDGKYQVLVSIKPVNGRGIVNIWYFSCNSIFDLDKLM